ncbi:MAG: hypothetical protein INR71_01685 [Terriglobus roseus]|nr:hypothetical protein [Terriglobus roseus]
MPIRPSAFPAETFWDVSRDEVEQLQTLTSLPAVPDLGNVQRILRISLGMGNLIVNIIGSSIINFVLFEHLGSHVARTVCR